MKEGAIVLCKKSFYYYKIAEACVYCIKWQVSGAYHT